MEPRSRSKLDRDPAIEATVQATTSASKEIDATWFEKADDDHGFARCGFRDFASDEVAYRTAHLSRTNIVRVRRDNARPWIRSIHHTSTKERPPV
jgi:hypothetical protein